MNGESLDERLHAPGSRLQDCRTREAGSKEALLPLDSLFGTLSYLTLMAASSTMVGECASQQVAGKTSWLICRSKTSSSAVMDGAYAWEETVSATLPS